MPRLDYKRCKGCGRHSDEVGPLSRTRQCPDCGDARLRENIEGLHKHHTPVVNRWRRGVAASVGGVLLDDLPPAA